MMLSSKVRKTPPPSHTRDPLLPELSIQDANVDLERQQCSLQPKEEGKAARNKAPQAQDLKLRSEDTAFQEAKRRCNPYTATPTEKQYLGQLILTFGKYNGRTFKWILENDVGYVKYILDSHIKEKSLKRPANLKKVNEGWVKEALLKYVEHFPPVSSHLEKNVDIWLYGHSPFQPFYFKEMWEWYHHHQVLQADPKAGPEEERKKAREAHNGVEYWLSMPDSMIRSPQMRRFKKYIIDKKKTQSPGPREASPGPREASPGPGEASPGPKRTTLSKQGTAEMVTQQRPGQDTSQTLPSSQFRASTSGSQFKKRLLPTDTSQGTSTRETGAAVGTKRSLPVVPPKRTSLSSQSMSAKDSGAAAPISRGSLNEQQEADLASQEASAKESGAAVRRDPSTVQRKAGQTSQEASAKESGAAVRRDPSTVQRKAGQTSQGTSPTRSREATTTERAPPVVPLERKSQQKTQVNYEGWHSSWETGPNGIRKADISWLKTDAERGMFQPVQTYRDTQGVPRLRRVLKDDRMWFHPPECPGVIRSGPPSVDSFFRSRLFFWRPMGVWGYDLKCPRESCPARGDDNASLYRCGYATTVRHICDVSDWYYMLTEVLACSACRKASKDDDSHRIGRFLSWDPLIMEQLTPAHRARFPAVLTLRRGVDKNVIRIMRDRTIGNTMIRAWRQVQESHCEEYLYRKDMYTTLLMSMKKQGSIVNVLGHKFLPPPQRKELPSARLLRKTYLLSENEHIADYRAQIMSTFGNVLKFDSTKKICTKLAGAGKGTAEWCTNVGNEFSQVLTCVLTCEESLQKLQPMAQGLMNRYSRAGESPPQVMYVDRGCCRLLGTPSIEQLFHEWVDSGMVIRLDILHWIKRFDAAVRTDHHPKYALFKSALSAAVFAYNKDDLSRLVQAVRAGSPTQFASLSDAEITKRFISNEDLQHYVRRVTVGAQESFVRVQCVIDALKGPAGKDMMGISLFKDDASVDRVWTNQQKHLECMQDPPGMDMYMVTKHVTRNGVSLPRYRTVRGTNSLEGFHRFLPCMIPGPRCDAVPFQVYLLSGIARWNSDRESAAVKGQQGRKNLVFASPLIHRLNERCEKLFGHVEEVNFRPPMPEGEELLGLEFLFSQSAAQPFDVKEHYSSTTEELQSQDEDDDEVTDAVEDDDKSGVDLGYQSQDESTPLTVESLNLTNDAVSVERDPCMEDVCGPNHLPGFQHVEELSRILVEIALEEGRLSLTSEQRQQVTDAWNKLDLHDRQIATFDSLYSSRWGNTLFGRTKGDPPQSTVVQKLKLGKRYGPAHLLDSRKNRLMYCIIKQLWLHPTTNSSQGTSCKNKITAIYQRLSQRITVDDPVLSKLGIPLMKINSRSIADFIRRQEALSALNATDQGLSILRRQESIADESMDPATELPEVRPVTSRPQAEYPVVENLAGTRKQKKRQDHSSELRGCAQARSVPSTAPTTSITPPAQPLHTQQLVSSVVLPVPPAVFMMPSTSGGVLTSPSSTQQHSWARSTLYKKRKLASSGSASVEQGKVSLYRCKLCGQSTQGHKKYRKKTFCPQSKKSSSLPGQIFTDFEDFKAKVDQITPVSNK